MEKKLSYHICVLVFVILAVFSSCISSEDTNYLQRNISVDPVDSTKYALTPFEEYKLAVGDNVVCKISTTDEETSELFSTIINPNEERDAGIGLAVYEDGTIILPFFGVIKVVGLTLQEAEMKVQDLMEKSVIDAQVKLTLSNNIFYIYSDQKRGQYRVYKENLTIYQALAIAGQTTARMDLSNVKIVRQGEDGKHIAMEFDLRTQDVIESQFYYVKPNDVIYFSTNKNSFFNITSVSSFISMVMVPLTTLFVVSTYKF